MTIDEIFQFVIMITAVLVCFIRLVNENNRPKPSKLSGYFV